MKRLPILVLVVLVFAGLGVWWYWPFGDNASMRLSGVVEIQEVRLGSKVGGRVHDVFVKEGEEIYPGKRLLVLENPEWIAQREQWKARVEAAKQEWYKAQKWFRPEEQEAAKAMVASAKARWERAEAGWRKEEKAQARSEWESAEADRKQKVQEYARVSGLFATNAISKSEYDLALAAKLTSEGREAAAKAKHEMYEAGTRKEDRAEALAELNRAKAKLSEIQAGGRVEDIELAKSKYDEAQAKLAEIEVYISEATLVAPEKLGRARVEVISVRPGDIVAPNQPLVRVLRTEDWWVKVFVPETKLGHVQNGKEVEVSIDTFPGKAFKGVVEQVANISEFTPRNVQSLDERRHQVFAVKVRVLNPEGHFHAGMAAEVVIPLH